MTRMHQRWSQYSKHQIVMNRRPNLNLETNDLWNCIKSIKLTTTYLPRNGRLPICRRTRQKSPTMPAERFKMRNPKYSIRAQNAKLNYQMRELRGWGTYWAENWASFAARSPEMVVGHREATGKRRRTGTSVRDLEAVQCHSFATKIAEIGVFASKCWDWTEFRSPIATGIWVWKKMVENNRWERKGVESKTPNRSIITTGFLLWLQIRLNSLTKSNRIRDQK